MHAQTLVRYALYLVLALAPLCGCATTTTVQLDCWHPVDFDVKGVDRLAVLRFGGKEDVAAAVRSQVLSELERGGFYSLVDEGTALRLGRDASYLGPAEKLKLALQEAHQNGIDALLAARLRGRSESGGSVLGPFQMGEHHYMVIELSYDLIHVPSGMILAGDTISRVHEEDIGASEQATMVIEEVARRLALECGSELVAQITAHQESLEVALSTSSWPSGGASQVSEGNQAAADGQWRAAMDHWHAALIEAPENHAALYNLGVAFEHFADHEGAAHWYAKAVAAKEDATYQTALARAEQAREGYHVAQLQLARQRRDYFPAGYHRPADPRSLMGQPTQDGSLGYR